MSWLSHNAASVAAVFACLTAVVATAALVDVELRLGKTEQQNLAQSARDVYGAHLALAASLPGFARPVDTCALLASDQGGAYEAFVDHMLYSAEQMLEAEMTWQDAFLERLQNHAEYLCASSAPTGEMSVVLGEFRNRFCAQVTPCD